MRKLAYTQRSNDGKESTGRRQTYVCTYYYSKVLTLLASYPSMPAGVDNHSCFAANRRFPPPWCCSPVTSRLTVNNNDTVKQRRSCTTIFADATTPTVVQLANEQWHIHPCFHPVESLSLASFVGKLRDLRNGHSPNSATRNYFMAAVLSFPSDRLTMFMRGRTMQGWS
jgi:hypothetical protein